MRYFLILTAAAVMLVAGLASNSVGGHHYHGYGCGFGMRGITDMDANQDGSITFDEFSQPYMNKLKGKFKMLDKNDNDLIDESEWKQFLKWHGLEDKPDKSPKS